jgi:glutamate/tyrosine decarboxylase-like PLP-dependent enzyme
VAALADPPATTATLPPAHPTAWSAAEIRDVGYRTVDRIAEYLSALPSGPVFRPVPEALIARFLGTPMPESGTAPDALLEQIATEIMPYPFGNGHPRFSGWVRSPPAVMGIFADTLAAALNPSVAGGNHAAVYVEHAVVGWFAQLLGFPTTAAGHFVTGGSAAALTALGVARHVAAARAGIDVRAAGLQQAGTTFTAYQTAEGHACHRKALELLGLGAPDIRLIDTDAALRMLPAALDAALARDIRAGCTPIAVIASAGTVNVGAIDPLDAIADICAAHGVWLHIDGAYGAPAILSARYAAALGPLARADSVGVDPHKWLYVPIEAGLVLVKDAAAARAAYSLVPPYLRTEGDAHGVGGPPWFSEFGLQQTRGFRALKVWASLTHLGVEGYRAAIEHDLALADTLAALVQAAPDLELWEPRGLSIVCFRYVGGGGGDRSLDATALDALNRALCAELQRGGEVFPTSTVLRGRTYLRSCLMHPGATPSDVERLVHAARTAGGRLARARQRGALPA